MIVSCKGTRSFKEKQIKITTPGKNKSDYNPRFLPSINKIIWLWKNDIISGPADLWLADPDGTNAKVWVHDVGAYSFFTSQ